jgi:alpha-beta hydrolase superfamily lysophospholipase
MKTVIAEIIASVFLIMSVMVGQERMKTESFDFIFEGNKLDGVLDLPALKEPESLVLIIQGYGRTNVVAGNWYNQLRAAFVQQGIACYIWDKPGCGKSEGVFDVNQSVQNSAREAIAAIQDLKRRNVHGSSKIELWGISRAGWICPLIIQAYPSIAFWISVSGTDDKENFGYLLETNLRIEGRSEEQTQRLMSEFYNGNNIFRKGGSFAEYQKATQNLRKDTFWLSVSGEQYTLEGYQRNQKKVIDEHHAFDEKTGLMIYVSGFRDILHSIHCPVLAIFGEKDANVDWRKTKTLYRETIGANKGARLTIRTFPSGNHNIMNCKTGGYHEHTEGSQPCDGYYDAIALWLRENQFGS